LKIIIDTNIIIDHLRNIPQATKQLQEIEDGNYTGLISVITITELMAAPKMSEQRFQSIKKLLSLFEIISVDSIIAKAAGNLLAYSDENRHLFRYLPDSDSDFIRTVPERSDAGKLLIA